MEPTRAIIVDDEELARSIIREYLAEHVEIDIVAECSNGFEAVKAFEVHAVDYLLKPFSRERFEPSIYHCQLEHHPSGDQLCFLLGEYGGTVYQPCVKVCFAHAVSRPDGEYFDELFDGVAGAVLPGGG